MLRNIPTYELFTILFVICLLFITLAKVLYPKRFNDIVWVVGNSKYLKIYIREQKFFDKFDALLFVNFIISIAVFCFICFRFNTASLNPSADDLFKIMVAIGSFVLGKVLLERLIGSLFEIDTLIDEYLFQKTSYKNLIGLLLFPINLFLLYSFNPNHTIIYIILVFLVIINILGFISTIKTNQSLIIQNLFYFILYLCALEIAPYIIIYKVFFSN